MQSVHPIILRPSTMPPVRVLEVDGPRRKGVQRGEGSYYLATDNHPPIYDCLHPGCEPVCRIRFKKWSEPHWTIYQHHDGALEIWACRPTEDEAADGDGLGRFGSIIRLAGATRQALRHGLRIARRLCLCRTSGVLLNHRDLAGIAAIESNIPVYAQGLV